MNVFIFIILLTVMSLYSCDRKEDYSFAPTRYREMGMPDYTKIWTEKDYLSASNTLYDIRQQYPKSLPRVNSSKSGEYFKRIINMENLYFLHDSTYKLSEKAFRIQLYFGAQSELINIYYNLLSEKQYYHRELIYLHNFSLNILHEMLTLAELIKKSEDPEDVQLQNGMQTVQAQYLTKLGQTILILNQTDAYPIEDLELLSGIISSSISKNLSWMDAYTKNELKQKLTPLSKSGPSPLIRENLSKALDLL